MTEIETTPKKAGRKPDPMTRVLNDLREVIKSLPEGETRQYGEARRNLHLGRASAWTEEFSKTGTVDALLLSRAFSVLSAPERDLRYGLILLAATALAEVEKLDGGR